MASTDAQFLTGEAENEPCLHYLMDFICWKQNILTSITTMLHLYPYQLGGLNNLFGSMFNYELLHRCVFIDANYYVCECVCVGVTDRSQEQADSMMSKLYVMKVKITAVMVPRGME